MPLILGSERLLYDRIIVAAKFSVDDFEITKEEDAPGTKGKGSLGDAGTGTIKVTYKPTSVSSYYRDGVVPPAHLLFERDLKSNLFKTR
ncbi:MAG: hypothetical protein ACE5FE_02390 [Acidiferrobacterales bacterium]